MRLCADLVRSSDELVQAMRAAYRVVLLDEYQDTSIAQRVILSTLFAGTGVTAVGDPMQAIYGWRSASVANIDAFAPALRPRRARPSSRPLGEPALGHPDPRGGQPDRGRAASAAPAGGRAAAPAPVGAVVRAALLPTVADEREWIADQVQALVESGTPPEDIAILGRANDQLAPAATAARGSGSTGQRLGHRSPDHQPVRDRGAVHPQGPGRPGRQHLARGPPRRAALADRPPRPRTARRSSGAPRGRPNDTHRLRRRSGTPAPAPARGQRVQGSR